jgi:protein TonB
MALAGSKPSRLSTRPARLPPPEQEEPDVRWRAVLASSVLHAFVVLALLVLALFETRRPEAPILVELVDAGAAGLAGGSDGGGGSDFSSAAPVEGTTASEAAAAPAPPPSAPAPVPDPAPPVEPAPTPPVIAQPTSEPSVAAIMEELAEALAPPPPPRPSVKPVRPAPPQAQTASVAPSAAQDPVADPSEAPPAAQLARAPDAQASDAQGPALERSPDLRQAAGPGTGAPGTAENTGATGSEGTGRGVSGSGKAALAGTGFGAGDDYLKRLRKWIKRHMEYPSDSKKRKEEGEVVVAFVIARDGTILSKEIRESSGYPGLDQAVLAMLDRASPVPPLPEEFPGEQARVVLPFQFELSLINRMF